MNKRIYLLCLVPILAWGCDSANPVAPSGTVLTVTANPTQIALSGEASIITVTGFRPDGNPLNPGTQITLQTNLGTLQPLDGEIPGGLSVAEADANGRVMARLLGDGRSGEAMVSASLTSGGDATAMVAVQIGETDTSKPTVVISANPTVVAVRGSSRISILGRATDGTPVGSNERVRLTADLGFLVEDGGTADDPPIDETFTDSNGEAFATFIAGDRGGNGEVAAILGTSEEVAVSITIRDAIDSVFLSASTQTIQRVDAGTMIVFTALLQDAQGEPVSGTIVNFTAERGTFDDNAVPSNSQGEAQATLTVTANQVQDIPANGTFTVTATATSEGNTRSASVDITVIGAP